MVYVRVYGDIEEKIFEVSENAPFPFDYDQESQMFRVGIDSANYLMIPRESVMYIYYKES